MKWRGEQRMKMETDRRYSLSDNSPTEPRLAKKLNFRLIFEDFTLFFLPDNSGWGHVPRYHPPPFKYAIDIVNFGK